MVNWSAVKGSHGEAMQNYFGPKVLPEDATLETDLRNEYSTTKWNELYPSGVDPTLLFSSQKKGKS